MSNKHAVAVKEIIIWRRQHKALREKNIALALWFETVLLDIQHRKATILFNYYMNKYIEGQHQSFVNYEPTTSHKNCFS